MRTVGIVQARMGSSRLPGKVLMPAVGTPLIVHMLRRVSRCRTLDALWLATSVNRENDPLEACVAAEGHKVFRGSEEDVLSRFWSIAKAEGAQLVVRLTGDCPLHDPEVIDDVVAFARAHENDYAYVGNALRPTYPDGLDVEVCTAAALDHAYRHATDPRDREHVMPYIHRFHIDPGAAHVFHFRGPADFSHLRWTLDGPADYTFIREVLERLLPQAPDFCWLDVVALLTREPQLLQLNGGLRFR